MNTIDTITALCTATGGAISIIRISGDDALTIGNRVWKGNSLLSSQTSRVLHYGHCFFDNEKSGDPALAVYMQSPNTYTGEDVVELHCHGGDLISKKMLDATITCGARSAEPGEFTFRAFMNGKLDLTQAEAVGDIIAAHSDLALNLAEKQMSGHLGSEIRGIRTELYELLSEVESRLDFGEEDLDWKSGDILSSELNISINHIAKILESRDEGALLRGGVRMVIAGRPNAGKSSLLNLILGYDRAIVTELPGTTRDTLEEYITIRGVPIKMVDTAGIREADDIIESIGIERSFASIEQAQIIIWIMDASGDIDAEFATMIEHVKDKESVIGIWNKTDLIDSTVELPGVDDDKVKFPVVKMSVEKSFAFDSFLDELEKSIWHGKPHGESEVAVSARHAGLMDNSLNSLSGVDNCIMDEDWELAAIGIREAIYSLGTISGEDADPDVLDNIFSRFCIGK